jgi:hypothetical protein
MNKNWKTYWKLVAHRKENKALHHFQYCVLKALTAKANNKLEIAESLLRRAFTPVTSEDKLANGRRKFDTLRQTARAANWSKDIFGFDISLFMELADYQRYKDLIKEIVDSRIELHEPEYLFIFVRQDISKEQQAVQAAHATFCAGREYLHHSPEKVNFVLVGVPDELHLVDVGCTLNDNYVKYVTFREPDLSETQTAIATQPLKEHQKRFLKHYPLLKFE